MLNTIDPYDGVRLLEGDGAESTGFDVRATGPWTITVTPVTASPAFAEQLQLDRMIQTTPFAVSTLVMRDNEGSAYVPRDDSLWLAADNGRAVFEINPSTGALKRKIGKVAFETATQLGGGPQAGTWRTRDFESMAYDETTDSLYVFSGPCCTGEVLPTAFRLKRKGNNGTFKVESYQPLAAAATYTAAGWNRSKTRPTPLPGSAWSIF